MPTPSRGHGTGKPATLRLLELFDFLLRCSKLGFELLHFMRIIHLFPRAGQALLNVVDFLVQQVDAFLRFFVHVRDVGCRLSALGKIQLSNFSIHVPNCRDPYGSPAIAHRLYQSYSKAR
jgi:hypothetical protein